MKHRRSNYFIITMLMCLSLISVGFASWNITSEPVVDSTQTNITTDIVINSSEYVYLDTTKGENGITCFNYCSTGYINSGNIVVDTGYINTYYTIDQKKCADIFYNYNSIKITIKLKYDASTPSNTDIFAYHSDSNGYRNINYTVNTTLLNSSSKVGSKEKEYVVEVVFTNLITNYINNPTNDTVSFELKYSLFATTGAYFKNNIYPCLYSDNISFDTIVTISGTNV